ncbi:hypothetical protein [Fowlpox virus]|uniref:Uncharacterized protein n=1 Tax=Fowlpox virus TaxID=10261 RepID=A0A891M193_FOWPV|nr:hypothetical protein [Fowlpox virus]UNS14438.1 ALPV-274 [Albatrosspox virus]UQT20506.1 hypothetical protein [Fowlpox virus]UQT20753.1 hypothetical protein [Fowlpox virus]
MVKWLFLVDPSNKRSYRSDKLNGFGPICISVTNWKLIHILFLDKILYRRCC